MSLQLVSSVSSYKNECYYFYMHLLFEKLKQSFCDVEAPHLLLGTYFLLPLRNQSLGLEIVPENETFSDFFVLFLAQT